MRTQSEIATMILPKLQKYTFSNYEEFADKAEDLIVDLFGNNKITATECCIMRQHRDVRLYIDNKYYYCVSLENRYESKI